MCERGVCVRLVSSRLLWGVWCMSIAQVPVGKEWPGSFVRPCAAVPGLDGTLQRQPPYALPPTLPTRTKGFPLHCCLHAPQEQARLQRRALEDAARQLELSGHPGPLLGYDAQGQPVHSVPAPPLGFYSSQVGGHPHGERGRVLSYMLDTPPSCREPGCNEGRPRVPMQEECVLLYACARARGVRSALWVGKWGSRRRGDAHGRDRGLSGTPLY